jgi:membrane-associated HD superfamily phosphohydrolase
MCFVKIVCLNCTKIKNSLAFGDTRLNQKRFFYDYDYILSQNDKNYKEDFFMNLYEIEESIKDIFDMIEENEGQYDDEQLLEVWESLDEDLKAKVDSWCKVIKNFKADEEKIAEEIERLKAKKKSAVNAQIRMKNALCNVLRALQMDKVKTAMFSVYSLKDNSKLVYDSSLIGDEYKVEYTSKKIDEKAIKTALENGTLIDGARLYSSLTIR